MGIPDTRRKGTGTKKIDSDFVLNWSGVNKDQRAVHGVGFILHSYTAKNILNTEYISERIVKIRVREGKKVANYIQIYAPCNDTYSDEEKDKFFGNLSEIINKVHDSEDLYVMGDFNGRVGERRMPWTPHLGPHSDHQTPCNYNGNLVLELCAEHELMVANTFFQHRPSHIYTWYKWNDMEVRSQIDFILIRTGMRKIITDAKVIPNAFLDTDHRPIILKHTAQKKKRPGKRKQIERINMRKLQNTEVQDHILNVVGQKLKEVDPTNTNVEEAWSTFKATLLDTLQDACGYRKAGNGTRKATAWWNEDVKEAIKEKKRLFKVWLKSKQDDDYEAYSHARRNSKRVIKAAKEASWRKYGEDLSELCKHSPREFYKSVKAMRVRDEPFDPTTVINDANGQSLQEEDEITQRGRNILRTF
ncbi:craniofacial development protein 2-like [Diadema antillarum]|uniref:craniofacial development protein 2-like n=1 Tax=Diadema antillarum TaxID=105358 RepID=UPI003A8A7C2F